MSVSRLESGPIRQESQVLTTRSIATTKRTIHFSLYDLLDTNYNIIGRKANEKYMLIESTAQPEINKITAGIFKQKLGSKIM
jgi:hypothetical protein